MVYCHWKDWEVSEEVCDVCTYDCSSAKNRLVLDALKRLVNSKDLDLNRGQVYETKHYKFKVLESTPKKDNHEGTTIVWQVTHKPSKTTRKILFHNYRGYRTYRLYN